MELRLEHGLSTSQKSTLHHWAPAPASSFGWHNSQSLKGTRVASEFEHSLSELLSKVRVLGLPLITWGPHMRSELLMLSTLQLSLTLPCSPGSIPNKWRFSSLLFFFFLKDSYVALAALKFTAILLPQLSQCWKLQYHPMPICLLPTPHPQLCSAQQAVKVRPEPELSMAACTGRE